MYPTTTRLCFQKNSFISGYSDSFLTNSLILAEVVAAAANSSLGIVLKGGGGEGYPCFSDDEGTMSLIEFVIQSYITGLTITFH